MIVYGKQKKDMLLGLAWFQKEFKNIILSGTVKAQFCNIFLKLSVKQNLTNSMSAFLSQPIYLGVAEVVITKFSEDALT